MKKLLLLILLLFVFSNISYSQKFKFGGQIRLRALANENYAFDSLGAPNYTGTYYYQQRSRVYSEARLGEVVGFFEIENNSKWGFRTNNPNSATVASQLDEGGDLYINNVFVDFPIPILSLAAPTFARIGRQYFVLGNGLIIDVDSDDAPHPLDGVRIYSKICRNFGLDVLYAVRTENADKLYTDDNMFGGILHLGLDRSHFLPDQKFHSYTFYERNRSTPDLQDNRFFSGIFAEGELPGFMNVLGIDKINYEFEYAHEYGNVDSSATGSKTNYNGNSAYFDFKIKKLFPGGLKFNLLGLYYYSTGDDANTIENEVFRSSYHNFRPSELFGKEKIGNALIRSVYPDSRFGRGGSNMQIMQGGIELKFRDISLEADYYDFLATKVPAGISNKLGNEIDLTAEYKFTTKLTSHLILARFNPGLFFSKNPRPANKVEFEIKLDM